MLISAAFPALFANISAVAVTELGPIFSQVKCVVITFFYTTVS